MALCWEKSSLVSGAFLAASSWQVCLDVIFYRKVATVGVTQKDQAHHGQEVFIAGMVRVCPQRIRRSP